MPVLRRCLRAQERERLTQKLTVIQLLPKLDPGGAERSAIEITQALVAAGHRAIIVAKRGAWSERARAAGAELLEWPIGAKSPLTLALAWRLRRLFAEQKADIVHARSRLPAWLAWWALRGMRGEKPHFVTTVHGLHKPGRYSAIMHAGTQVIAVSETAKAYVLKHYPDADAARIRVIQRGVDTQTYRPAPADPGWQSQFYEEFPQLAGKPWLLLPGRGTRLKGHHYALHLLADLDKQGCDVGLLFAGVIEAGRENYLAELNALTTNLGVRDRVAFSASRSDLIALYRECALVLQLSGRPESFGRTVAESLSCGTPVLGFAHGGVGEQLANAFPQGAVPLGDQAALCERARALLQTRAQVQPGKIFQLAEMQQATLALYAELAPRTS